MKNRFIYPTRKNMLIGFFLAQVLPVISLGVNGKYESLILWVFFELVIVGCLSLWQLKPIDKLDEREMKVTLKWKSKMLDYSASLIIIPIVVLSFWPEVQGWDLYIITVVPIFLVFIYCSMMVKKEFGYFFCDENRVDL